jgi:hypothetical protein
MDQDSNRRTSNEKRRQILRKLIARYQHIDVEPRHTRTNMGVLRIKNNHPTWCGPVAVAFLTGCTVNDAAQLYTNVRNRNVGRQDKYSWMRKSSSTLSGVYPGETRDVLNLLGYEMCPVEKARGVSVETLASRRFVWEEQYQPHDKILVSLPGHYVVVHRYRVSDNHAQHVPAGEHPFGDKKVDDAWRVIEKPYGGYFAMTA